MKYFILLLTSIFTLQTYSQYDLDWAAVSGSEINKSIMDKDSNIYVAGNYDRGTDFDLGPGGVYRGPLGGYDFFVVKLNKNGVFKWVKTFRTNSCTICHDWVNDLTEDGNENVILVGDFVWAKKFQNNIFSSGNAKVCVNDQNEIHYTTSFMDSIDADPSSATLYFTTQSSGTDNILIVKLKSSGILVWEKSIEGTYNTVDEFIYIDSNSLLLTGKFRGSVDFDIRNSATSLLNSGAATHSYLLKINSDTVFEFVKEFTTNGTGLNTQDIYRTSDSSILLCGNFVGTADFDPKSTSNSKTAANATGDAFILKLTNSGSFLDAMTFGGAGNYNNSCKSIKEDNQ